MVTSGGSTHRAVDQRASNPVHRSGHPEFVQLVAEDPLLFIERGQPLFVEGDVPTCMYIVKTGQLQIRSGGVIYEDVGPGGVIGEMGVIETQELRSATVYALTDSELVEINDARFAQLIARSPSFAIAVMRTLSRRLRAMDRRDGTL
jgi:CRP/FNR family transcriptional regulator, cyclic AMP receptor protein